MATPVKLSCIYDNPSYGSSVTSNPFCCRVDNDICAVVYGSDKIATGSECIVNHNGYAGIVCYFGNGFDVWYVITGIPYALDVNRLRFVIDRLGKVFRIVTNDELGVYSQTRKEDF